MRFKKLDLNLLVALDAMLTERSISRAAERVHLTQSAMSNALARLREYFDDQLLVQVGRKMELTPRAELLKDAVRDVLVRVDTTIAAHPDFVPEQADREFRLYVSDYSLQTLIPHVLALTQAQAPGVRFQLLHQRTEPHRALERGEIDLLVIPRNYCSQEHPLDTLFNEAFQCVVWRHSRRWSSDTMSLDDYANAGHVVMLPAEGQPSFETWFMDRYGLSRHIEVTSFNFTSVPFLVVGTDRVATVHSRLAQQARQMLPLKCFVPPLPIPEMEQAMQWHKYRTQDPALSWLRSLFHEAVIRMNTAEADHAPPDQPTPPQHM
ncbi:MAG: LysR family transcriptional regulator [Rhodocyclaceae bacterium]